MRVAVAWDTIPTTAVLEAWYMPLVAAATDGLIQIGPPSDLLQRAAERAGIAYRPLAVTLDDSLSVVAQQRAEFVVVQRQLERGRLGRRRLPTLPGAAAFLRLQGRLATPRRILLASAGGPQAVHGLAMLTQLARRYDASVTVLHVLSQQQLYYDGFDGIPLTPEIFLQSDMPEALNLQQVCSTLEQGGVTVTLRVASGLVAETILAASAEHDILAVGAHRAGMGLERLLLADLTRELAEAAAMPVLVLANQTGPRDSMP